MYSKLSLAFVAALAAAAQAESGAAEASEHRGHGHGKHHRPSGLFPSGRPYQPSGSAPFPTGVVSGGIFPTGTAAGTGVSGGSGPEQTGDTTLTYTIGAGDHTTVITTTIHHTNTHTDVSRLCKAERYAPYPLLTRITVRLCSANCCSRCGNWQRQFARPGVRRREGPTRRCHFYPVSDLYSHQLHHRLR